MTYSLMTILPIVVFALTVFGFFFASKENKSFFDKFLSSVILAPILGIMSMIFVMVFSALIANFMSSHPVIQSRSMYSGFHAPINGSFVVGELEGNYVLRDSAENIVKIDKSLREIKFVETPMAIADDEIVSEITDNAFMRLLVGQDIPTDLNKVKMKVLVLPRNTIFMSLQEVLVSKK